MFKEKMINENSLINEYSNDELIGYSFEVRIPFYRSVPLSCVEELVVSIDDNAIDTNTLRFVHDNKTYKLSELSMLMNEWWGLLEKVKVIALDSNGLTKGKHVLELTLKLRWPILIPAENQELPNYDTNVFKKEMIVA